MVGSFLNVVIVRLPRSFMESSLPSSLWMPGSQCPQCQKPIRPSDNIPVLSYCWLKGKCRFCQCSIPFRYPAIELLTAILSVLVFARFGISITTAMGLLLTWALIPLAFIDMEYMILPDNITIPFLWIGLFISIFFVFQNSTDAILGAILGYLSLASVYWIYKLLTKKEGMGFGDFKLAAMLGAWLGWQALPFILFLSTLMGSLIGITLILLKKQHRNMPIPFGPYLALSGWIAMLLGPNITFLYQWIF